MNWLALKELLESKKIITESGCWILSTNKTKYPKIYFEGNYFQLTRVTKLIYQNIEIKNQANHKCDNNRCFNPDHIYDGTQSENILESYEKGRSISKRAPEIRSLSCAKGHPHNKENTYFIKKRSGKINKVCKICSAERQRNRRNFQRGTK